MIKKVKIKLLGIEVKIMKLSAKAALKSHGQVIRFISPAVGKITSAIGGSDEEQTRGLTEAFTEAFNSGESVDEIVDFIDSQLTNGLVVVDGKQVQHLDDLDRFEDIDGSELMYAIFAEWVKLNLGSLLKKIGGTLAG